VPSEKKLRSNVVLSLIFQTPNLPSAGGGNEIRFMPKEETKSFCRIVPDYVPTDNPGRIIIYHGTFGVPCGATHVKNLNEVSKVSITKVEKKDKAIRVSYSVP
jgi:Ser-tRNA(Ala) deacylase AlaX